MYNLKCDGTVEHVWTYEEESDFRPGGGGGKVRNHELYRFLHNMAVIRIMKSRSLRRAGSGHVWEV
jgi:hypothetical protein